MVTWDTGEFTKFELCSQWIILGRGLESGGGGERQTFYIMPFYFKSSLTYL